MGADNDIVERLSALEAQEGICGQSDVRRLAFRDARAAIVRLRGEVANGKFLADFAEAQQRRTPAPAMPNGVEGLVATIAASSANASDYQKHDQVVSMFAVESALRAADNRDAAGVDSEEDAYVIERMGKLLAEIAVIVNGPEPPMTRWSYHDLPEKVRALKDTPAAVPAGEAVAHSVVQIGNRGAAYDPPNTHRAFTYEHQPGNIDASRLGRATAAAAVASAGDSIDRGLSLLKELQAIGFGVFQIGPPAPVQAAPQEGEAYQPVRFGGIRRPSDEALAAAFWEHRQRENSLPADLCDSNLVKFGNDIVRRARELAPYLTTHSSACELGAVREALEAAARSLRTIAEQAGKTEGLDDMMNVRGYANSRANVAELALQHRGDSRGGEGS